MDAKLLKTCIPNFRHIETHDYVPISQRFIAWRFKGDKDVRKGYHSELWGIQSVSLDAKKVLNVMESMASQESRHATPEGTAPLLQFNLLVLPPPLRL